MSGSFPYKAYLDYRLLDLLGSGGMGNVYRAIQIDSGKVVAVKILHQKNLSKRFLNEAKVQTKLKHPNIVSLFDFFEYDDKPWLVTEYVDGTNLDKLIQNRGKLCISFALEIFKQLLSAIAYLHHYKIIHRDIKPDNIRIKDDGTLKLMDFGIAKNPSSPKLTQIGFAVGTVEYMSPEQFSGNPGLASDIWSLGVVLYEMLMGKVPFSGADERIVQRKIENSRYELSIDKTDDGSRLVKKILECCLNKDHRKRPSASQLIELLDKGFMETNLLTKKFGEGKTWLKQLMKSSLSLANRKNLSISRPKYLLSFAILIAIVFVLGYFTKRTPGSVENSTIEQVNYDSIMINVVNVRKANIVLDNGMQMDVPYLLVKEKDKKSVFIIRAQGYKDKEVILNESYSRKSYDYVMEKEK